MFNLQGILVERGHIKHGESAVYDFSQLCSNPANNAELQKSEEYVNFDYHSTCPPIYDYLPINISTTKPWLKLSSHAVIAACLRVLVTYSVLFLSHMCTEG